MHEGGFSAVLFDWRGTLFYDESDQQWIMASAATIGRQLTIDQADALARALAEAEQHSQVREARLRADCSLEQHQAATLLHLRLAGFDADLAMAVWQRDGNPAATFPYPDTAPVLRVLKQRGVRVGVTSDIHYDLRPVFDHYGLGELVDSFTLSFQHRYQQPDARLFRAALAELGTRPADTLMVGDRPGRDGGALGVGITTLLLPPVLGGALRGLGSVLRLVRTPERTVG